MTFPRILPYLFLAACGGMKSVPVMALAEVSTASVKRLAVMEEEVKEAKRALVVLKSRQAEIARNADSANLALESASDDMDSSMRNRGEAVSEGDVATAQALSEDMDLAKSTVHRRKVRAIRQTRMLDLFDLGVDVQVAQVDVSQARLELARAQAAADGGADLKLGKYERQNEKFQKVLDRETAELRELEASRGTTLVDHLSPAPLPTSLEAD